MKYLKNIPLLIAIILILGITPFAIKLVQENQNLQNRAATDSTKNIPCIELTLAHKRYCLSQYPSPPPINMGIPCSQIANTLKQYCL